MLRHVHRKRMGVQRSEDLPDGLVLNRSEVLIPNSDHPMREQQLLQPLMPSRIVQVLSQVDALYISADDPCYRCDPQIIGDRDQSHVIDPTQ